MNVPTSAWTATFGFQNMSEFCNYGEKIVKSFATSTSVHIHNVQTKGTHYMSMAKTVHKGRWLHLLVNSQILKYLMRSRRHFRDMLPEFLALIIELCGLQKRTQCVKYKPCTAALYFG